MDALDASTKATYDTARKDLIEGTGGYSGTNNPYAANRMRQIGLQQINDQESNALESGWRDANTMKLGQLSDVAHLTAPQYITTGQSTQNVQSAPPILGSIISGGLGVAAAF